MLELKPYTPPKCFLCKAAEPSIEMIIGIDPGGPDVEVKTEKKLICEQCSKRLLDQFEAFVKQNIIEGQQSSIEPKGILSEITGRDCEKCECTTCQNPNCATEGLCPDIEKCHSHMTGCEDYIGGGPGE